MIEQIIARELECDENQVKVAVELLDTGNTVPFIARYRKEKTGGLDDGALRHIEERLRYLRELQERKETVLAAIDEQGKLDDTLKALILGCETKARLEDLYAPFKKRRRTKADQAREAGLQPLADEIIAEGGKTGFDAPAAASSYVCEGFADAAAALEGARAIIVDQLSLDADLVGRLREEFFTHGTLTAKVVEGQEQAGSRFADYFDYREELTSMPSHRILAVFRGEAEKVLTLSLDGGDDDRYVGEVLNHTGWDVEPGSFLAGVIARGWRSKLGVSAALDARMRLKELAEDKALEVFATNLHDVLLAAPAGTKCTLGVDPGYRNGCKCAVVDATGKVVDTVIVYPHQPVNKFDHAVEVLARLCLTHSVELIAVGNGTASRESLELAAQVKKMLASSSARLNVEVVTVSESGASVYSASAIAAEEFPDMDVSLRGAVSIARRLQDPLAELVKIDPKSIGVGQYQHDVNQQQLARTLDAVVEDAVNAVGVDINTASWPLLTRVAGISSTLAKNIVAHREDNGPFKTRNELKKVARLGEKAFLQCAGFCRINKGVNPLDGSAVHPEAYPVVDKIAAHVGVSTQELIGNSRVLTALRPADFADGEFGEPTVRDIIAELDKPGRDPRPEFTTAQFKEGIDAIGDLTPGMILEGTVTNVAAFGAFVDIGVHQDGLVHISAMKKGYVSDPRDVVRSGETVTCKVLSVDVPRKRISLTLRLDDEVEGVGSGSGSTAGSHSAAGASGSGAGASGRRGGGNKNAAQRGGQNRGSHGARGGRGRQEPPAGGSLADALRKAGFGNN